MPSCKSATGSAKAREVHGHDKNPSPWRASGQPRPRAFARRMGDGKFVARVFESGTAEGWKSLIAAEAAKTPISGPGIRRFLLRLPASKVSLPCRKARARAQIRRTEVAHVEARSGQSRQGIARRTHTASATEIRVRLLRQGSNSGADSTGAWDDKRKL